MRILAVTFCAGTLPLQTGLSSLISTRCSLIRNGPGRYSTRSAFVSAFPQPFYLLNCFSFFPLFFFFLFNCKLKKFLLSNKLFINKGVKVRGDKSRIIRLEFFFFPPTTGTKSQIFYLKFLKSFFSHFSFYLLLFISFCE